LASTAWWWTVIETLTFHTAIVSSWCLDPACTAVGITFIVSCSVAVADQVLAVLYFYPLSCFSAGTPLCNAFVFEAVAAALLLPINDTNSWLEFSHLLR